MICDQYWLITDLVTGHQNHDQRTLTKTILYIYVLHNFGFVDCDTHFHCTEATVKTFPTSKNTQRLFIWSNKRSFHWSQGFYKSKWETALLLLGQGPIASIPTQSPWRPHISFQLVTALTINSMVSYTIKHCCSHNSPLHFLHALYTENNRTLWYFAVSLWYGRLQYIRGNILVKLLP